MNKPAALTLLLTCLVTSDVVSGAGLNESEVITLTKPGDIQQASVMDNAIVRLSNKVMECVRDKLAPDNQCFCLYPQELADVRTTYEMTIKEHPNWKNRVVSYAREGKTVAVSFGGVSRQLESKCTEPK